MIDCIFLNLIELGDKTLRKIELEKLHQAISERKTSAKNETDRIQMAIDAYKRDLKENYHAQFEDAKIEMKKV